MTRKKDNTTLLVVAAVAVAGYFAFKHGGWFSKAPAPVAYVPQITSGARFQDAAGIAVERPTFEDIGIIVPKVDPTGMTINFY